jgi:hypothetical protein
MVSFQTQNPNLGIFWVRLEDLVMKNVVICIFRSFIIFYNIFYNILRPSDTLYGPLVILQSFGIFFPALVHCTKKHLATLLMATKVISKVVSVNGFFSPCSSRSMARRQGDQMRL